VADAVAGGVSGGADEASVTAKVADAVAGVVSGGADEASVPAKADVSSGGVVVVVNGVAGSGDVAVVV
jgi:hypothetical protein